MKQVILVLLQLVGSLSFLLYGMKMMSDGIQKSAGQSLHKILGLMTGNRFFAVLTGLFVTMLIQSSGATTVMVVSFVNAGLMTLAQSVGVILGANIGTTITAWIVAVLGFSIKISTFAIPLFGLGYILTVIKSIKKENIGEALMGFGLLFLGLDLLSKVMQFSPEQVAFVTKFTDKGLFGVLVGLVTGIVITMILHSSSASTAIILTMAHQGLLQWEFAAVMVLGSNIGSTIDAVLASVGTKVNARRAALVHVLFNVLGTILALIFLNPLLKLVDYIVPGDVYSNMTIHIAMLHTIFNLTNTIIFLPFTKQLAALTEKIIEPKENETPSVYKLVFTAPGVKESAEAYLIRAEKEIENMIELVMQMFVRMQEGFKDRTNTFVVNHLEEIAKQEDYADQMQEQLSNYLVQCSKLPINDKQRNNISMMLHIVDDMESLTDDCYSVAILLKRSIEKKMSFSVEDMDRLEPYMDLVQSFLEFIKANINKHLTLEQLNYAEVLEDQIDMFRKNLKKVARKRLENGADVKTELLYIDLVRNIEKIGDRAFSISESLSQTQ